ncbi:MAG TPA: leucyl/phenylalanyl-tRNA--protein transferase [Pyrinomonadaceae bacterium]|nr:leucyl/phenylalanyl-tRNA--protein transferase [Pyrinomonadaceae bacterium]
MARELFPKIERSFFPDPRTYDFPEWVLVGEYFYHAVDVVSFGTPLTVESVQEAYSKGIFPWYMRGIPLPWYCPQRRAILDLEDLHISRSLAKARRQSKFTFTIDRDFEAVIQGCATIKRPDQGGTWITADFIEVYGRLHLEGHVHSVEAWNTKGELAGGLYGVDAGGVFCGESMFHREPNASKLALLFLIDHLRLRGSTWLDCQVMTPHMKALGAKEIERRRFLNLLLETQASDLCLFPSSL